MRVAEELLDFWLGPEPERDTPAKAVAERWWVADAEFDRQVAARWGDVLEQASAGGQRDWEATPRGRLALVVLFDQFSRNIYRDKPGMYENDEQAVALTINALDRGDEQQLRAAERLFLYMPLMHAEELELQERCVRLIHGLAADHSYFEQHADFAERHRNVVARFGRFPHRNSVLGRTSTAEEIEFLLEGGRF